MSKLAFLFPGQGSQQVGMLGDLAAQYPSIQQNFSIASHVLGYDLWELTQHNPNDQLNQTQYTQPALLAANISLWQLWQTQLTTPPAYLAGHSLGEYAALVAADVIDFAEAIRIVAKRGEFMQQAVPPGQGAMAAIIGLAEDAVASVCEQAAQGQTLSPANYNAIGQVVIAGNVQAVERALPLAKEAKAKLAKLIPVSVPSHCALMAPAAKQLAVLLNEIEFKAPRIPVIHNVDAKVHMEPAAIKQALIAQLDKPVQWVTSMQALMKEGVTQMVECGPGKVLAGLMKRIDKSVTVATDQPQGESLC